MVQPSPWPSPRQFRRPDRPVRTRRLAMRDHRQAGFFAISPDEACVGIRACTQHQVSRRILTNPQNATRKARKAQSPEPTRDTTTSRPQNFSQPSPEPADGRTAPPPSRSTRSAPHPHQNAAPPLTTNTTTHQDETDPARAEPGQRSSPPRTGRVPGVPRSSRHPPGTQSVRGLLLVAGACGGRWWEYGSAGPCTLVSLRTLVSLQIVGLRTTNGPQWEMITDLSVGSDS